MIASESSFESAPLLVALDLGAELGPQDVEDRAGGAHLRLHVGAEEEVAERHDGAELARLLPRAASRLRFCSAPAAEPQTAADGARSSATSGPMPPRRRTILIASGSELMLCTAPTARVRTCGAREWRGRRVGRGMARGRIVADPERAARIARARAEP